MIGIDRLVCEIASPASGHQNFSSRGGAMVQNQYLFISFSCLGSAHQARCAGTDNNYIKHICHGFLPEKKYCGSTNFIIFKFPVISIIGGWLNMGTIQS